MVLQLDPRLPVLWRSPQSLQLGLDHPPVVLEEVSAAQERMIAALSKGISRGGLGLVAKAAGGRDEDADGLLKAVHPALTGTGTAEEKGDITIVGGGATVSRLADALTPSARVRVASGRAAAASGSPDVAVLVSHFVIEPEYYGLWLRRDQVHLPIVFGDTSVRIGPFIEPGAGPCLYCIERTRTDADPAWPAIASQLWGRRSPLDAGLVAGEVAAAAARLILARLERGRAGSAGAAEAAGAATSVTIDAGTGARRQVTWARHPECGCAALPGTETGAARPSDSAPSPTTTEQAGVALA